jgi:hypothetical protein
MRSTCLSHHILSYFIALIILVKGTNYEVPDDDVLLSIFLFLPSNILLTFLFRNALDRYSSLRIIYLTVVSLTKLSVAQIL